MYGLAVRGTVRWHCLQCAYTRLHINNMLRHRYS
eukprot:COSAG01_NODE_74774_length_200_cov_103.217822_1_plen_33_part_10